MKRNILFVLILLLALPFGCKKNSEAANDADVYWSSYGHAYHLFKDCPMLGGTGHYTGTLEKAIKADHASLCSFCAKRAGSEPQASDQDALFPAAKSVRPITGADPDLLNQDGRYGNTYITCADAVLDASGTVVGYVVNVTNRDAYNPPMKLAVGVNPDGTTAGIVFLELNETPGKGSKADEPAFKEQFRDRDVDAFVLNDNIDAITGATVTSKAVVNAVNAALDFYRTVINP